MSEWEDRCDRCANCCRIPGTDVACPHLDTVHNACRVYENRHEVAPWCRKVLPESIDELHADGVLPDSCAYVRHAKGQPALESPPIARLIPYTLADQRVLDKHRAVEASWGL